MEGKARITKKTKIAIAVSVCAVAIVVAIVCGIVFSRKDRELTTQEWLDKFSSSMNSAVSVKDEEGNILSINVMREIEIKQDGVVVATYRQKLQIYTTDGQVDAYLLSEEKYPTLGSDQDDVLDEYYLSQDIMYTRRLWSGESQMARFDSDLDTLLLVARENIGERQYSLVEENFSPREDGGDILSHENDVHKMSAKVVPNRYAVFLEESAVGLSNMTVDMQMKGDVFEYFLLEYEENNISTKVKITRYDTQAVTLPQWLE